MSQPERETRWSVECRDCGRMNPAREACLYCGQPLTPERETREPAPLRQLLTEAFAAGYSAAIRVETDCDGDAPDYDAALASMLDAALSASAVSAPSYPCGHKVPRLCPFCNRLAVEVVSAPTPQGWQQRAGWPRVSAPVPRQEEP